MNSLKIENIGWTLGNDCPYRCPHCYSTIVRNKGRDLTKAYIDRIVGQLASVGIKTVNLGGNEPIFTNGLDPKNTLLPYIIRSLYDAKIIVGLTTAGITLRHLERFYPETLAFLNDMDISLDSPFAEEHNQNRGAPLFRQALRALDICNDYGIKHTVVMCGMNWNLSDRHIDELVRIAREYRAFVRINFIKPTEAGHMDKFPDAATYYRAAERLLSQSLSVEMGEPLVSAASGLSHQGCPCGTKSFRIHSITPDGKVPVSPCVYAHDFKVGDLLTDSLSDIINSVQFQSFRNRRKEPQLISGCNGCRYLESCRGGCASRAYLVEKFKTGNVDLSAHDPYCIREMEEKGSTTPKVNKTDSFHEDGLILVHRDYLCTLIVKPK
ncbi:MAG TPA: radical SAM protein [Candidatus Paceibacterota bacterium]|nr:radical SAM protein [Candidatus Paceibacterota bacterium]